MPTNSPTETIIGFSFFKLDENFEEIKKSNIFIWLRCINKDAATKTPNF